MAEKSAIDRIKEIRNSMNVGLWDAQAIYNKEVREAKIKALNTKLSYWNPRDEVLRSIIDDIVALL